jgi:hypothetical protein
MKWSTVLEVASIGTRVTAPQVVSLVDLLMTMSLAGQPDRNRQSCHTTYTVPAESTSAEGSGLVRSPPATVCDEMVETSTVARQLAPPSMERNERIWPEELWNGTMTVPLGRTTGWPPRPLAASPVFCGVLQVLPPLVERLIFMRLPAALSSNWV